MRRIWRRRPSPAMIVACLALLIALGGTGVATVNQLGRSSVGPLQLRNGAVTNPKIRNNAVTSAKVRNRSLLRSDFAPGQLTAGPTGPQGPVGPAGPAGPAGAAGGIGAVTVRTQAAVITDLLADNQVYATQEVSALCSSGELAISGGANWSDSDAGKQLFVGRIRPVLNATNQVIGFLGSGLNDTGQASTFTVSALCYPA